MSDIGIGVFLLLIGVVSLVVVGFSAGYWFRSLTSTGKKNDAKKDLVIWNETKVNTAFSKELQDLLYTTPLFPVHRYAIELERDAHKSLDGPHSNLFFIREMIDSNYPEDKHVYVVGGFRIPFSHLKGIRDLLDHHIESNRILNGLGDKRDSDKNEEVKG